MKPITTSSYTFPTLIEGGYLYVDKTEQLLELINKVTGQYFLSRPRRFGKSLLISTIEALFSGRRELFKGLYIDGQDDGRDRFEWKKYPVIRLDMGSVQATNPESLEVKLQRMVQNISKDLDVPLGEFQAGTTASDYFLELVRNTASRAENKKVVILVDEYDKPLLNHLGSKDAIPYRDILKSFYSVIKTTEGLQRFAFITGVSKITHVSIFSDLNNLTEITMDERAATLLGYTRGEVKKYFADRLPQLAEAIGKTEDETLDRLARWYDGFCFHARAVVAGSSQADKARSANTISVFNPVSVGKCFETSEFKNFWFTTATPTFLLEMLKKKPLNLQGLTATEESFSEYSVEDPSVLALMVQAGYLTIKGAEYENPENDESDVVYRLDFPNHEIRMSFNRWLVQAFSYTGYEEHIILKELAVFLRDGGDVGDALGTLSRFFAKIPYDVAIEMEKYYQSLFLAIFVLLNAHVRTEVTTNVGRIDAVVETPKFVYVFEFKLNGTADAAMKQIHEKKYYEPYLKCGKKIMLVGVAFNHKTRNIGAHKLEIVG